MFVYFSFSKDKITELLDLVLNVPNEEDKKDRMYRYPFIANDLLKSGSPIILNYFFGQDEPPIENASESVSEPSTTIEPEAEGSEVSEAEGSVEAASSTENSAPAAASEVETSIPVVVKEEAKPKMKTYETLDIFIRGFFERESYKNSVLCGYFQNIISSFFDYKKEDMIQYLHNQPKVEDWLINFCDNYSISSLASFILNSSVNLRDEDSDRVKPEEEDDQESLEVNHDAFKERLIKKYLERFVEQDDYELRLNIKQTLISFCSSTSNGLKNTNMLLRIIMEHGKEFVELLSSTSTDYSKTKFEDQLNKKISAELLLELIKIFDKNSRDHFLALSVSVFSNTSSKIEAFQVFSEHVFEKYLKSETCFLQQALQTFIGRAGDYFNNIHLRSKTNNFGHEFKVLDTCNLTILEAVLSCVSLGITKLQEVFIEKGLPEIMLTLFQECKWNSFYQGIFTKFIKYALSTSLDSPLHDKVCLI